MNNLLRLDDLKQKFLNLIDGELYCLTKLHKVVPLNSIDESKGFTKLIKIKIENNWFSTDLIQESSSGLILINHPFDYKFNSNYNGVLYEKFDYDGSMYAIELVEFLKSFIQVQQLN